MRICFILIVLIMIACGPEKKKQAIQNPEEALVKANKELVREESKQIDSYIDRRGWKMEKTGTGLRYMIYQQGNGAKAQAGQTALIHYTVSLLDGTECYTSKDSTPREFRIGQDDVESGLHEGVLLMKVGDKARFIMPPHLAHGLTGDQNKIPAMSTIIYDVELVALR